MIEAHNLMCKRGIGAHGVEAILTVCIFQALQSLFKVPAGLNWWILLSWIVSGL